MDLCVVTINEKPWIRAREVCKALEYIKKTVDLIKAFCSRENYDQKHQLIKFPSVVTFLNWPKASRKDDYYINEEGMHELLFSSQQLNSKGFRKHCCNVMFPQIRQQLTKKKMQHLHCSMMIYRIVTTKYRSPNMKTWHCKHKEMFIRPSHKDVKTPFSIFGHVM